MIQKYIGQKFRNSMQLRAKKPPGLDKDQQENLLSARETDDKNPNQPETTRGRRNPPTNRQDSLQSESHMSMQSKYSGKFASGGPKIGYSAFNPVQVNTKEKNN